ncbi:MAG: hypothetical protein M1133_07965 [Armatimonadetes bacterium]|nr:hypothetical protein [Armatimonadota bacterium]
MATLHVRNIPDDIYQAIQALASQEQRSIGAEVAILLERALEQESLRDRRMRLLEEIGNRRRSFRQPEGAVDSLTLLREDRAR